LFLPRFSRVRFCSPSLFRLRENQLLLTAGGCYPGVSGGFLSPGVKKNKKTIVLLLLFLLDKY